MSVRCHIASHQYGRQSDLNFDDRLVLAAKLSGSYITGGVMKVSIVYPIDRATRDNLHFEPRNANPSYSIACEASSTFDRLTW